MVNSKVKLMHTNITKALEDICDVYVSCEKCPYRVDSHSTVFLDDDIVFASKCAPVLMLKAFDYNESMEDTK